MRTENIIWTVVGIIAVIAIGWYFLSAMATPGATTDQAITTTEQAPAPSASTTPPLAATIALTAQGFLPPTVTIAQGGTVTFVNQTAGDMWVASDPHPDHTDYDGTTRSVHCAAEYAGAAPFDQCATGTSFSFTFSKIGTWGYHNHDDHAMMGTVVVQ